LQFYGITPCVVLLKGKETIFLTFKIDKMEILITLIIGALAGWLGSMLYKGSSLGLIGNIVIGIIGSVVGSWLLTKLGVSFGTGIISSIFTGALGAIVILFLLNLILNRR